MGKIKGRLN